MVIPDSLLARDYFSAADVRSLGVGPDDLRRLVLDGRLTRIRRGWYSGMELRWPVQRHALLARIEVAGREGVRLSHYSDLAVLGLPVHRPDLTVVHLRRVDDGRRQRRAHVVVHGPLTHESVAHPRARAILETALLDPVSALMAADHALRSGRTTLDALEAWTGWLASESNGRLAEVVTSLADARRESPGESRVAWELHGLGYRTSAQVMVEGQRGTWWLDLGIEGEWVAVEYDGEDTYTDRQALLREKAREDDIRAQGWEVVRVTRRMLDDPRLLRQAIEAAIARSRTRHPGTVRPQSPYIVRG